MNRAEEGQPRSVSLPSETTQLPEGRVSRRPPQKKISRRAYVYMSGVIGILATLPLGQALFNSSEAKPVLPPPETNRIASIVSTSSTEVGVVKSDQQIESSKDKEFPKDIEKVNKILALPLDSPERKKAELEYFRQVKTLEQIDLALGSFFYYKDKNDNNWNLRAQLIDKRFELRMQGDPRLTQLDKNTIAWIEERGIHPEILGIALDAQPKARKVIAHQMSTPAKREKFRPDIAYKEKIGELPSGTLSSTAIDDLIINAGGLARLISTETGVKFERTGINGQKVLVSYGFINLGMAPAITQINSKNFPDDKSALGTLCNRAQGFSGLAYDLKYIPGSIPTKTDSSGGAIMAQIMPKNMLDIDTMFREAGEPFLFTDVTDMAASTQVFLAQGQKLVKESHHDPVTGKDIPEFIYRYGYLKGTRFIPDKDKPGEKKDVIEAIRLASLGKWNGDPQQINSIIQAANDYYEKFVKPYQKRAA
ncbi:MAG: hypothetical protein M1142_00635 [Patescibacteria group bacterium]|nr:hypothetical protein [Patescibacteria group bacterium]